MLVRGSHAVGIPQEEGMMSIATSFPSERNQGYQTIRTWTNTYAQHNQKTLPQRNSEVVNLTGLLITKDKLYSVDDESYL